MNRVFISYRRGDSQRFARQLRNALEEEFPDDGVFLDEGGIPAGEDYVEVLRSNIKNAYLFLPVIGKDWLRVPGDDGKPRIEDKKDVLRREIDLALKEEIEIVPVLSQGARMPSETDLPDGIRLLARYQGARVREPSFDKDMRDLMDRLRDILQERKDAHAKEDKKVDELTKELFGDDEDGNWEPPLLKALPGVRLSQFESDGEWELEMRAPHAPDAFLGPKGGVSARFSVVRSTITEGAWTTHGTAQGAIEGYIGYQLTETESEDPRLLGVVLEGIFGGHERFRVCVPIDERVGKTYHGRDDAGRTYSLKRVGRAGL